MCFLQKTHHGTAFFFWCKGTPKKKAVPVVLVERERNLLVEDPSLGEICRSLKSRSAKRDPLILVGNGAGFNGKSLGFNGRKELGR